MRTPSAIPTLKRHTITIIVTLAAVPPALLLASQVVPGWLRDSLLLAGGLAVVLLWWRERRRHRQHLLHLAARIDDGKLEISDDPAEAALHRAINGRLQQRHAARQMADDPTTLSVLATSYAQVMEYTPENYRNLEQLATLVQRVALQTGAQVQVQGSGVFLLIFGLDQIESLATTSAQAVKAARLLSQADPKLHFGLSCGLGVRWNSALGELVVGSPIEEAMRLMNLAHSWREYTTLCPEPLALLLGQQHPVSRTPLELTNPVRPPLRVYSLRLSTSASAAVGA